MVVAYFTILKFLFIFFQNAVKIAYTTVLNDKYNDRTQIEKHCKDKKTYIYFCNYMWVYC